MMPFATYKLEINNKNIKINLKARYTQKGSIIISTDKGDIVDLLTDGTIQIITHPYLQYSKTSNT